MKIINYLLFLVLITSFIACEKAENKIYFEGGTQPVITASTTSVRLEAGEEANNAIRFAWTNPDYKFTTGLSSHDVTYTIEIDTAGAKFGSGAKVEVVVAKDLFKDFTVDDFNKLLTTGLTGGKGMGLQIKPRRMYNLEARVTARIGAVVPYVSQNQVSFTASPFAPPPKVALPSSGNLYITGGATPGDWMAGGAAELLSQKFTKISNTEYEIIVRLNAGGSYLFVPVYGDWGDKYGIATKNDPALVNGGDFSKGSNDIMAPAKTANYKIRVDFQTGKFTVVEQ